MKWKPDLNLTTNARVFTAAYIGALVMGPPIGCWTVPDFMRSYWGLVVLASSLAVPLGGFIAGVIAGRNHAISAALLALFLSKSASAGEWLVVGTANIGLAGALAALIVASLLVGLLVAWTAVGGGVVSERHGLADRLQNWGHWGKAGVVLVLLFTYSLTLGRSVAARHIGCGNFRAYPVGVYIGVAREPLSGFPNNPTYYMDPTGILVLGYFCIRT